MALLFSEPFRGETFANWIISYVEGKMTADGSTVKSCMVQ